MYNNANQKLCLDFGCGKNKLTRFIGVDKFSIPGVDYVVDFEKKNLPFNDVHNRHSSINLVQIEKLCLLLHSTPNDLINWTPNPGESNYENQPLMTLLKSNTAFQLSKVINSIPLNKLSEIEKLINEKLNETNP